MGGQSLRSTVSGPAANFLALIAAAPVDLDIPSGSAASPSPVTPDEAISPSRKRVRRDAADAAKVKKAALSSKLGVGSSDAGESPNRDEDGDEGESVDVDGESTEEKELEGSSEFENTPTQGDVDEDEASE